MNDYEEKRQARIDRLHARADALGSAAESTIDHARRMADVIPFGQPILVGHHSEGRDRRYRGRIDAKFRKGFALAEAAKDAERRAIAAEDNDAVSSDDPDAVDKLRDKVAKLKKTQDQMVRVNRALRAGKTDDEIAALTDIGITAALVAKLREPDFCGRTGFADYQLKNNSANIRRLEQRIEELAAKAVTPAREPETIGHVRIEESENRVRVFFAGKPSEAVRSLLKSAGFRWSPTVGAWQRQPGYSLSVSADAWDVARKAAELAGQP